MRIVLCCSLPLYVVMGMVMSEMEGCFDESITDLINLQTMVGNGGDIKLYCPDLAVIENCQKETLECFKTELYVLDFEYDGTSKNDVTHLVAKLNYSFNYFLSHLNASKGCQHCEIHEEEPVETFLTKLLRLLQFHNHNICPMLQHPFHLLWMVIHKVFALCVTAMEHAVDKLVYRDCPPLLWGGGRRKNWSGEFRFYKRCLAPRVLQEKKPIVDVMSPTTSFVSAPSD